MGAGKPRTGPRRASLAHRGGLAFRSAAAIRTSTIARPHPRMEDHPPPTRSHRPRAAIELPHRAPRLPPSRNTSLMVDIRALRPTNRGLRVATRVPASPPDRSTCASARGEAHPESMPLNADSERCRAVRVLAGQRRSGQFRAVIAAPSWRGGGRDTPGRDGLGAEGPELDEGAEPVLDVAGADDPAVLDAEVVHAVKFDPLAVGGDHAP